jgi:hypothetical protein
MRSAFLNSDYNSRMMETPPQAHAAHLTPLALLTALRRRALNNATMR